MSGWGVVPSGDRALDARRTERVRWHRVLEAMDRLVDAPHNDCEHTRDLYLSAKASWWAAMLRLDGVRT